MVSGLTGAVAVSAGENHSLAVKSDGTVWAWGYNNYGQLGNGYPSSSSNIPLRVSELTGAVAISAGYAHSLALKSDGTVWAWGFNGVGELGNGTTNTSSNVPVQVSQVSGLTGVVAIGAGSDHNLAVKSDGTVWAWGFNDSGQLGNGTISSRGTPVPVQVSGLTGAVVIAAGSAHSLA